MKIAKNKREQIKTAAMEACKSYGYDWVMAGFEYDDADVVLKHFKKEMKDTGRSQVCIFDGEEPYYALERTRTDDGTDMVYVLEEGDIFTEGDVYHWITLGRIDAWKELLKKKSIGYFCDGYGGYVFDPRCINVEVLKNRGRVVVA